MQFLRRLETFLLCFMSIAIAFIVIVLVLGAYSQHRIAVIVNQKAVSELVGNLAGSDPAVETLTNQEIARMQAAQNELFDRNTISFIFQVVTAALVTVGVVVLRRMTELRETTEKAAEQARQQMVRNEEQLGKAAEQARRDLRQGRRQLKQIIGSGNSAALIALKYGTISFQCSCLDRLIDHEGATAGLVADESTFIVPMRDTFHEEIPSAIDTAIRDGHGIDPGLFGQISCLAANVNAELERLLQQTETAGKNTKGIKDVRDRSRSCLDLLEAARLMLVENYGKQWNRADLADD